jgi:tetratricopeptide (TPR) repeat protein
MSGSVFTPKTYQSTPLTQAVQHEHASSTSQAVLRFIQVLVVSLFFMIPLFFTPQLLASLGFDKAILALGVSSIVLMFVALSALRFKVVATVLPLPLLFFGVCTLILIISGLVSGDIQDSFRGSLLETQTIGFFSILTILMAAPLLLQRSKAMFVWVFGAFGVAATLLFIYIVTRIIGGSDVLSLKTFSSVTVSPVGSFNDMALFSAVVVIVALILLAVARLHVYVQVWITALLSAGLFILALVNFYHVWLVVGFLSLLLLVYVFTHDTLFHTEENTPRKKINPLLLAATVVTCVCSAFFVIAGDHLGAKISTATGINHVEVRPSLSATIDIARAVYTDNLLLGVGPNRFSDAWRLHKDSSINETLFWNTDFTSGFGLVPTLFVTGGVLGGVSFVLFHLAYLYFGYRLLMRSTHTDSFWYSGGVVTFVIAVFLWGMTYVYVPGPTILLLAALFTGLSFVPYRVLVPGAAVSVPLVTNQRRGFFLMTVVIFLIIGTIAVLYAVGRQYVAERQFSLAVRSGSPETFETNTRTALSYYRDDVFSTTLAEVKASELQKLLAIEKPTESDQQQFITLAVAAVSDAEQAIALDPSNPNPYATLASILSILARAGVADAEGKASSSLADAAWRDPKNPTYSMMLAYMALAKDDTTVAKEKITEALTLKRNYSDALSLLAQVAIKEGNVAEAIVSTRQLVAYEPQNAGRYYQLGVLLNTDKKRAEAIAAFEKALSLDEQFANARYLLALSYLDEDRVSDALVELRKVQETNKDNVMLRELITRLETTGTTTATGVGTIQEPTPTPEDTGAIISNEPPTTNLVTPVNSNN